MNKETIQEIEKIINKLAGFIEVKVNKCVVSEDEDNRENFVFSLEVEDASGIIGKHGETLRHFQHLVRLMYRKATEDEEKVHFTVDVNNYRDERRQQIIDMVNRAIKRVIRDDEPVVLDPMPAYERKIAHNEIQKAVGIESQSIGEDPERKVVIKPVAGGMPSDGDVEQDLDDLFEN